MIERLQRALQRLEDLSLEAQEELADEIEEMASAPDRHTLVARATAATVSDGSLPLGVAEALALAGA